MLASDSVFSKKGEAMSLDGTEDGAKESEVMGEKQKCKAAVQEVLMTDQEVKFTPSGKTYMIDSGSEQLRWRESQGTKSQEFERVPSPCMIIYPGFWLLVESKEVMGMMQRVIDESNNIFMSKVNILKLYFKMLQYL